MCLTSSGQVAGMAKGSPQSPTDVIFVALGALDFGIYEDDLIVGRDVAVVSLRVRSETVPNQLTANQNAHALRLGNILPKQKKKMR